MGYRGARKDARVGLTLSGALVGQFCRLCEPFHFAVSVTSLGLTCPLAQSVVLALVDYVFDNSIDTLVHSKVVALGANWVAT